MSEQVGRDWDVKLIIVEGLLLVTSPLSWAVLADCHTDGEERNLRGVARLSRTVGIIAVRRIRRKKKGALHWWEIGQAAPEALAQRASSEPSQNELTLHRHPSQYILAIRPLRAAQQIPYELSAGAEQAAAEITEPPHISETGFPSKKLPHSVLAIPSTENSLEICFETISIG